VALKAYERSMAEARATAAQIGNETRLALKADGDKQRAAVDAELAIMVDSAEKRIAEAKTNALTGVRAVAIEVASAIVEKVLHERASVAELGRAVDDELAA
jgi:F-type H+-transporting ATPase subunit b